MRILGLAAVATWVASASADTNPKQRINSELGLLDSTLIELNLEGGPEGAARAVVPIDGVEYDLLLWPHSVRSAAYQLLVQVEDGSYVEVEPGPVRTMRGVVGGIMGSVVAASFEDEGLTAMIRLPDGQRLWIEPVGAYADAAPNQYVLYSSGDVMTGAMSCGVSDEIRAKSETPFGLPGGDGARGGAEGAPCVTELACDADVEYFNQRGSVANVESRINSVVNGLNVQYETEVGITHVITAIITRTAEPDPYTTSNPGNLLDQFRNHWQSQQGGIQRDVAELFTGKNMGGVAGIAFLNGICNSSGYNVVINTAPQSCRTDLSAHELGHNWSATHCSCPSFTMNPSLTCSNQFNQGSINQIVSYRNSRGCIECGVPIAPPSLAVVEVEGTGANLATADVAITSDPLDWWTVGGITSQAAGLAPLAAGVDIFFQVDPNTGGAVFSNVGGGGNPGNAATFVSLPRGQFATKRFGADGKAEVAGAYDPTGPTATLDAAGVNIGFLQFPPSVDGSDVPDTGYIVRVTLDLSGTPFAGQEVVVSTSGPPGGFPFTLGEFKAGSATREFTSPLTELTFGFYTTDPPPPDCPGDLNGDDLRDLTDLSIVLSNFGTTTGADPEDGDFDGDGDVDLTDLSVMLSVFGQPC